MKVFVLGSETVDLNSLLSHEVLQTAQLGSHFIPHPPVLVFPKDASLVFGEDPGAGKPLQPGTSMPIRADEVLRRLLESGHQG
jgi:hypothetical protein